MGAIIAGREIEVNRSLLKRVGSSSPFFTIPLVRSSGLEIIDCVLFLINPAIVQGKGFLTGYS
jgi:hypothetical protein